MPSDIPGIHHVTAIGSGPGRNLSFYTETLGLRLVKKSVNQDDVSVYHLFYADRTGTPGTSMTFFPYQNARQGQVGTGQASTVSFLIPADSTDYWIDRLADEGVDADEPRERFGDTVIPFRDPDGLPLELVAREDAPEGDPPAGPVPEEHAIRGFFGVTLSIAGAESTANLLKTMGFSEAATERDRSRYESDGDPGYVVDICEDPQAPGATRRGHRSPRRVSRDGRGPGGVARHPDGTGAQADRAHRPQVVRIGVRPRGGGRTLRVRHRGTGVHRRRGRRRTG